MQGIVFYGQQTISQCSNSLFHQCSHHDYNLTVEFFLFCDRSNGNYWVHWITRIIKSTKYHLWRNCWQVHFQFLIIEIFKLFFRVFSIWKYGHDISNAIILISYYRIQQNHWIFIPPYKLTRHSIQQI